MGQVAARSVCSSKRSTGPAAEPSTESAQHRALLKRKLDEIDELLQEMDLEDKDSPGLEVKEAGGRSSLPVENPERPRPLVTVQVGTTAMAVEQPELVKRLASMINGAYGYQRVDRHEVRERMAMGDPGSRANRVIHIAFHDGTAVGCMSSTFRVPWAEEGCGHWGLLVVDVEMQGQGIATALVAAAEERLAGACVQIQMEYEYTPGDAYSERLKAWYEGKCGFRCVSNGSRGYGTQFRKCRKPIPEDAQQRGRRRRMASIREELVAELAELEPWPDEAEA